MLLESYALGFQVTINSRLIDDSLNGYEGDANPVLKHESQMLLSDSSVGRCRISIP